MKVVDEKNSLLQGFLHWRERHIKDKQFVLILSFLVGICTALAACLLKFLVEYIKEFLTENFDSTGVNWLYLVYPVVGIFLTGLFIRKVVRDDISHGVTKILYAISRKQSRIKRHNVWSPFCFGHYHRLWWIGRCRSADCADRFCHWLEFGQYFPYGPQDADAAGGMWSCRGRFRVSLRHRLPVWSLRWRY